MKKKVLFAISFVLIFLINFQTIQADGSSLTAKELKVKMQVSEEGLVDVEARYHMDFSTPHRGIFINVPSRYEGFKLDDLSLDIFFPIRKIEALSDQKVHIEQTSAGSQIRFGEEDLFLEGEEVYAFHYQYELRPWISKYRDMDAFFASVIEENLAFPVEKLQVDVDFPKEIKDEPSFNLDAESVLYDFDGKKLHFEVLRPLYRENVSFSFTLPQDYFTYIDHNYEYLSMMASFAFLLLSIYIYRKVGKDYPLVKTVEFYAPEGFSSAETAYIYKGDLSASDVTSLIVMWASQGYLSIEELSKSNMRLIKEKDLDSENIEEQRLFNALFSNKDAVETKTLKNKFHGRISYAQENIPKHFKEEKSVFERKGRRYQWLFLLPIILLHLFFIYTATYRVYPETMQVVPYLLGAVVASSIQLVAAMRYANSAFPYHSKMKFAALFIFAFLLEFILISDKTLYFYLSYAFYAMSLYLWSNFYRRSRFGTEKYAQILGFADFIQKVEKPRLEKLLDESPSYFYDVMPYAQVLGLSKAWAKKFQDLEVGEPDWYRGQSRLNSYTGYYVWQNMNRSMRAINSSLLSVPTPKVKTGQSGSSSGGGFSGGSGGGFGGMSGGGW